LTASRALLRDLQAAFWDVPERKTKKAVVMPAAQLERHEPAPKLEAVVKPVTNTARAVAPEDVVATIDRVEERNDLRPRSVTNAARQSRWRSKQDADALRLQARERMKALRARRRTVSS